MDDKKKMDTRPGILIVSVTIFVLCFVAAASATNWSVDGSGDADFTGIQDAINNASDGDTINVHSGVYYENVAVDKSVTLRGIGQPVVDAGGWGNAITLTADGITLVGFTATNAGSSWQDKDAGIKVISSNNNTITGNNASNNNREGIYLYSSSNNNSITGNNVCNNNAKGIYLYDSRNNIITGNNVCNNNDDGIHLYGSSNNNIITGNNVNNSNWGGIYLYGSSNNNTITGNNICNNNGNGISLSSSCNNTITGNNVCNNYWGGISLDDSSDNNTITGNNASNNYWGGIGLSSSCSNNITGNNASNNYWIGISLSFFSNNNTITGNVFANDGLSISHSYQNTVEDNTVNGKPLVYLEDVSDYKVEDAGQVILVNCNNITVENLDLSYTCVGIGLWETKKSIISNNTASDNGVGIYLDYSCNNTITGNNVCSNNKDGICLDYSGNNTITGNHISNNNEEGICLHYSSSNNTITGNNVNNNSIDGIRLSDSSNNKIYLNNFMDNSYNVDSHRSTTLWNSSLEITYTYNGTTYKSYVGNYWGDYKGTDAEGDGIGDTPYLYIIDSGIAESDLYPLMKPFENYIITTSAPA